MQQQRLDYIILIKDKASAILNNNIEAVNSVSQILSSCLGPLAMQKMILTRNGSLQITNDGNAILREIDVSHPAAKILIDVARTQDLEVGDGTTSVILMTAELLSKVGLLKNLNSIIGNVDEKEIKTNFDEMHPVRKVRCLKRALEICLEGISKVEIKMKDGLKKEIVSNAVQTKLCKIMGVDVASMALKAVEKIFTSEHGVKKCDLKNLVKVEKILDVSFSGSEVLDGVLLDKILIHPQMRRRIENPRIVILDSGFEYKKGESQTKYEFKDKDAYKRALEIEEEQVLLKCEKVVKMNPDIVLTEKGICDLAIAFFKDKNVTALRRLKKSEAFRVSKAVGAKIINNVDDLDESCVGKGCGLFEYVKIGQEFYFKFDRCKKPKAISILLKGTSRDILNELERNLYDALKVAKTLSFSQKLVPGGGAIDLYLSNYLANYTKCDGNEKLVFKAVAEALKIIPITLARNSCADDPMKLMAELEQAHKKGQIVGIDGVLGRVGDTDKIIYEPSSVKAQALKSAFGCVCHLLRVDGVIEARKVK
ncbi:T-complex protein 1 subunit gamma [Dictyocoela muelleri]|nr:T-complex protein 1 subunit gamma [Dictyocoela muelleri]